MDESPDADFYRQPRFVTHIDDQTINELTAVYRENLPAGGDILDLMSSWVSHLPGDVGYGRVAGLGMNEQELAHNPRLSDFVVHNLNQQPELPYRDGSFDAVINAVSIQYLIQPLAVFAAIARVLRPGGLSIVAMSHRLFPTKATAVFHTATPQQRVELVMRYHNSTGAFEKPVFIERTPAGADPLWVVMARGL
jgi:SAM-dependent methyltransferase